MIDKHGANNVSFVRMEATTNLIGGQPFSLANLQAGQARSQPSTGIPLVIDCSLISENAYFIKQREEGYEDKSIHDIIREMMDLADLIYLSGRKSSCVRGGLIATNNKKYFEAIKPWLPVYEGFFTYGGMSTQGNRSHGRRPARDDATGRGQQLGGPDQVLRQQMIEQGIPAVTPPGGLAGHVDAMRFLPHVPQSQYPAGALAAAVYLVSGVRSMERGTISMDRDENGNDVSLRPGAGCGWRCPAACTRCRTSSTWWIA